MAAGSRYGVTLKQLRELMEHRGHEGVQKIEALGGSSEVARKLNTSASAGLSGDRSDLEHRRDVFGSNTIPPKPPKTFLQVTPFLLNIYPPPNHDHLAAGVGGAARRDPDHPPGGGGRLPRPLALQARQ